MEQRTNSIFFALLRSALTEQCLSEHEKALCSEDRVQQMMTLAKHHDLAHLLGLGLKKNGLDDLYAKQIRSEIMQAAYRQKRLEKLLQGVCAALEAARIPFVPLKGSVLRGYYPEPWMRTSCDVDILIHREDIDRAVACLERTEQLTQKGSTTHDVSLYSAQGEHLELHFTLVEGGKARRANRVLETVWEHVKPWAEDSYQYEMEDGFFYFYHIAHMAKHFESGGCGIRPFMDLWLLEQNGDACQPQRDALLAEGDLLRFSVAARKLSRVWFWQEVADTTAEQIGSFILSGGVYGTRDNRVTIQRQQKGGKLQYAVSKVFLPYEELKYHYPILEKHRWLTPAMEVRRWCKLAFGGHAGRTMRELQYNSKATKEETDSVKQFLKDIGL